MAQQWLGLTNIFAAVTGIGQTWVGTGRTAAVLAPPSAVPAKPRRQRSRDSHVVNAQSRQDLARVCDGDKNLAVWHRSLPAAVVHWLDMLSPERFPKARIVTEPRFARARFGRAFLDSGISASPEAEFLLDDLEALTEQFCEIAKTQKADIRLDSVGHDACHKFHVDFVTLRLLMSYCGAGTEWLTNDYADKVRTSGLEPRDDIIHQLPRFSVGLFKGSADRMSNVPAILHRSPAVRSPKASRFLVCMDTVG